MLEIYIKEGDKMPYEVTIENQKDKKRIKKELKTLKELKELLLQYENELINIEMHEVKTKNLHKIK